MRVSRNEAFDMLRKWLSEGALVGCNFECARFAAAFRGRVREVLPDMVRLLSDDAKSELALDLALDLEFGYGEPKAFSEEAKALVSTLVVSFPPPAPGREPERDAVVFTELVDS
jgi:hypothetical protein